MTKEFLVVDEESKEFRDFYDWRRRSQKEKTEILNHWSRELGWELEFILIDSRYSDSPHTFYFSRQV